MRIVIDVPGPPGAVLRAVQTALDVAAEYATNAADAATDAHLPAVGRNCALASRAISKARVER